VIRRRRIESVRRYTAGFSYIEVLVASVLIAISLGPALEALSSGVQGSSIHTVSAEDAYILRAKLEAVLAESFLDLDAAANAAGGPGTASSYSDVVTLAGGRTLTRNVYLAGYDGDNADADNDPFTGADPDLLWVRVAIPDTTLELQTLTMP